MRVISFKRILIIILLIVYIYSIQLTFLPITCRQLLGILGLFAFVLSNRKRTITPFRQLAPICIFAVLWGFWVCILNNTTEYIYLSNFVTNPLGVFFGSYFICWFSKNNLKSIDDFIRLIFVSVFLECVLTVFIYFSPLAFSLFERIQHFNIDEDYASNIFNEGIRFYGLGSASYFGVLPSCAIGLMSGIYTLMNFNIRRNFYVTAFMLFTIISVSFLISRFSLILSGTAIGIYLMYMLQNNKREVIRIVLLILLTIYVILQVAYIIFPDNLLSWAMAAFSKDSEHSSTNRLLEYFTTSEFGIKTLLIGDGRYTGINGTGYYKNVDVGILRQIYYGGIIGLFLTILLHYRLLRMTYLYNPSLKLKLLYIGLFCCYFLTTCKGDLLMIDMFMLLFNIQLFFKNSDTGTVSDSCMNNKTSCYEHT